MYGATRLLRAQHTTPHKGKKGMYMDKKVIIVDSDDNSSPESRYLYPPYGIDYCRHCYFYNRWMNIEFCEKYQREIWDSDSLESCQIR